MNTPSILKKQMLYFFYYKILLQDNFRREGFIYLNSLLVALKRAEEKALKRAERALKRAKKVLKKMKM